MLPSTFVKIKSALLPNNIQNWGEMPYRVLFLLTVPLNEGGRDGNSDFVTHCH